MHRHQSAGAAEEGARGTVFLIPPPYGTIHGNITTRERAGKPNPTRTVEKATDKKVDGGTRKRKELISRRRETEMGIERRTHHRGR